MKKELALLLILISFIQLHAQDIIIKRDGSELKGKVTEISLDKVKVIPLQDSVAIDIEKSAIVVIRYQNGTNEVFVEKAATPKPADQAKTVVNEKFPIKWMGGNVYTQNGRTIRFSVLKGLLLATGDEEIRILLAKAKTRGVFGNIMAYASIPVGYVGVILLAAGAIDGWYELVAAGSGLTAVFIMSQVGNPILKADKRKKIAKAIDIYNAKYLNASK